MPHMAYFNFADINQGDANHLFRPEQGQMCLLVHVHYCGADIKLVRTEPVHPMH